MTTGRHRGTARDAGGGAGEGFRERFEAGLGFPLDGFQHRALDAVDGGVQDHRQLLNEQEEAAKHKKK